MLLLVSRFLAWWAWFMIDPNLLIIFRLLRQETTSRIEQDRQLLFKTRLDNASKNVEPRCPSRSIGMHAQSSFVPMLHKQDRANDRPANHSHEKPGPLEHKTHMHELTNTGLNLKVRHPQTCDRNRLARNGAERRVARRKNFRC